MFSVLPFTKTRLAPTPSGFLHAGNALNFLLTATLAQRSAASLLLRIDDLDRVSGAKIFQQLEAINFISDIASGPVSSNKVINTVFVLGMDSHRVAKNLGSHILDSQSGSKSQFSDEDYLEEGIAYLQKLVQLTVPVPFEPMFQKSQANA